MNSSSGTTSGGGRANKTGNSLEQFVEHKLKEHGYTEFWDHKRQVFANRTTIGGKQYGKQIYCGKSIYETDRKCDFLVLNQEKWPDGLIIECKWQQSSGSVDEKYPFAFFNICKIGVPTVVLLDGNGYKPAAMRWLKEQAHPQRALIAVYNMVEFQTAVNNGFLG
ncbi:MAG: DpnII family type II restriction endonuclease [bacterium]|nr:DpnII family type II restriction endonuclease [bacterium]